MTIIFLDCETLGLDPDRHAIWEVAAIKYDEMLARVEDVNVWQIALTREEIERGDPIGMKIGGFDERRWAADHLIEPGPFSGQFSEFTFGAHLAGSVVSFDEERLRRLLLRHGVTPAWHYHLIDVEALAVGYLNGKALRPREPASLPAVAFTLPWSSDDLSTALGVTISEDDRHTAFGDAAWALRMYKAVMT